MTFGLARVAPASARRPAELIAARYGEPGGAPGAWSATLDTLLTHRSIRSFRPDPLAEGVLETLVAAAQSAASSSNLQVWSVVAVEDPARKARLSELAGAQAFIRQAPLFLVWLVDHHKLRSAARAQGREAHGLSYVESLLLGAVDTSLAAQNATVAAESLGLGAVYVGAIRNRPLEVARELALPPHVFPLFGMAVGHPDPAAGSAVKPRLPQEAVLFREQHGWSEAQTAALERYNAHLRTFQRGQGLTEQDWTTQAVSRTAGAQSLAGRHLLRQALETLGFEMR